MKKSVLWRFLAVLMIFTFALAACQPAATPAPTDVPAAEEPAAEEPAAEEPAAEEPAAEEPAAEEPAAEEPAAEEPAEEDTLIFGLVLVGPYNDHGWSEAHFHAGEYVVANVPNTEMIYIDKVNTADRPGTTPAQLAEELLAQGAEVIFFTSDDMKDGAVEFAQNHPEVPTIFSTGDTVWEEGMDYMDLPNMSNVMGEMEIGKAIAGCTAALTTQTGQIGYLGPLINDETRRLTASAYLGARYCWENYLGNDPAELQFKVTWIGFWFNIPGVTSDPTQVADDFYNSGYDVVISGIDTTEALTEAGKMNESGNTVWAIPYDYVGACEEGAEYCLGVPYFNWGPTYAEIITSVKDGTYESFWEWIGPDWSDINNPDTSMIGFEKGAALSEEAAAQVDQFIAELAGGLDLWSGPIYLQDGTEYVAEGEVATDQEIWYLPQLLQGMEGQSVSE
jgi:simple sugar transport system substrate-binding protein